MKELKALLEFKTEFHWSKDVLDKSIDTTITGIPCTIYFPKLNNLWFKDYDSNLDYLHMPLEAPSNSGTWYIGDEEKIWGYPISYPSGINHISDLFCIFKINENDDVNDISKKLYNNILSWKITVYKYLKLLSKQLDFKHNEPRNTRPLTLYFNNRRIQDTEAFKLTGIILEDSSGITYDIATKAISLATTNSDIPLHYELILSAYTELENNNFRKAVIDASTSLEVLLTQRLNEEFKNQGISFGEKLLRKYTTIKGRFELMNVLNILVPTTDYNSKILEPRNKAIHGGNSLSLDIAKDVINEVEKYLNTFSPLI